jgi:chemotaxis protein methyltransferase CheR
VQAKVFQSHNELMHSLQNDEAGYLKIAAILLRHAGISMPSNEKNRSLMASRLIQVIKDRKLGGYSDYAKLLNKGNPSDIIELTECLTTNKTDFFREAKHFEILEDQLPRILSENLSQGRRQLRVWCAAASTGQEPYTIAITLQKSVPELNQWDLKFLASDIDTQVLKRAASGVYSKPEMAGLSNVQIETHFSRANDGSEYWKASSQLRDMISFAQFNLMTDPFPFQHRFDIIFCRNVLIYFDRETSAGVVKRLSSALRPGGLLFIGHTESGIPKPDYMEQIAVAAYINKRSF